ncbi:hypothetical protein U2I53_04395 [Lysinibacillus capsici]
MLQAISSKRGPGIGDARKIRRSTNSKACLFTLSTATLLTPCTFTGFF